jgi:hypothetical protein
MVCEVHGTSPLLALFTLVAVYSCPLQFLVLERWLNMLNSHVIYEVLNLVHKGTLRRRDHIGSIHVTRIKYVISFSNDATALSGPGPPHYRSFTITLIDTRHTR